MPRALYQVPFSNFSTVTHYFEEFGNQSKIKWTMKQVERRKIMEGKKIRKKRK